MAILAGGGLSNLFDRYTKGYVVDYLRFPFGPKKLRRIIFNVSDFFVFMGALLTAAGELVA
jgi:signal peptidase II